MKNIDFQFYSNRASFMGNLVCKTNSNTFCLLDKDEKSSAEDEESIMKRLFRSKEAQSE